MFAFEPRASKYRIDLKIPMAGEISLDHFFKTVVIGLHNLNGWPPKEERVNLSKGSFDSPECSLKKQDYPFNISIERIRVHSLITRN